MFFKTSVLESRFNKVADLKACHFIKKRLQHRCFPVNIAKILKTAFFIEHLWWLLLGPEIWELQSWMEIILWGFLML